MSAPVGRCVASWERGRVRIAPWQVERGFGPIFGAPKSGQEKEPGTMPPPALPLLRAVFGFLGWGQNSALRGGLDPINRKIPV